jgi:hypothetical protein
MALAPALLRAAPFVLSLVGIGCSEPEAPTAQAWADGEIQAITTLQHNSGRLFFALPSLRNEWSMKHLTDAGVAALLAHPELPPLESLSFLGVNITDATVRAVVASPKSLGLADLSFAFVPLGDAGLEAISAWPGLATAQALRFEQTGATAVGLKVLASGPHGQEMPALSLKWNPLGDAGAEVLSTMKMRGLLEVNDSDIRGAGARALIERAPSSAIYLEENPIGPGGLVGLKKIGEGLRGLYLGSSGLTGADAVALSALPSASLQALDLSHCDLGDVGVDAIAKAPWLSNLSFLILIDTHASDTAHGELRTAWGDRKGLNVDGVWTVDPEGVK